MDCKACGSRYDGWSGFTGTEVKRKAHLGVARQHRVYWVQFNMAIYHLSAKIISRGKGQSAAGSASYRRGAVLLVINITTG